MHLALTVCCPLGDTSGFIRDAATEGLGGLVAGGLLVLVGYLIIDKRVHLRDALARQQDRDAQNEHNRKIALETLLGELKSDAGMVARALENLPKGHVPYPLFDTTMLAVVFDPLILTTLKSETVEALVMARNRMATANEQHALVMDLRYGQTAIVATMVASASLEGSATQHAYNRFIQNRDDLLEALLDRCTELRPHLDRAIDAVEAELGIEATEPSAQRDYKIEGPVGQIGS